MELDYILQPQDNIEWCVPNTAVTIYEYVALNRPNGDLDGR
jgi:hypothetical protein